MHIRLISHFLEMAYSKKQFEEWVRGQVDNIVENYILIYIARHSPAYDTMPETIPHWVDELLTAMSVVIGKEPACSRPAIVKMIHRLLSEKEEIDHNADVIRRKTWRKMKKERVDQSGQAYAGAVASLMKSVSRIAELIGGTDPDAIEAFVESI